MKDKTRSGTQRPTDSKEGTNSALWILTNTASTRLNLAFSQSYGRCFCIRILKFLTSKEANNCEMKANKLCSLTRGSATLSKELARGGTED